MPKNLITSRSEWFREECEEEPKSSPINLPFYPMNEYFETSEVFSIYLQLLYSNSVVLSKHKEKSDEQWTLMVELYKLSSELGDLESCNLVIDEITEMLPIWSLPSAYYLTRVYENSKTFGSNVRQLLVDFAVDGTSPEFLRGLSSRPFDGKFPPHFVADVIGKLAEARYNNNKEQAEFSQIASKYHLVAPGHEGE